MAAVQKITIEHQIAEIGVRTTPARLNITQPRMQMRITSESPQMEINRQTPTFTINRRQANAESGLMAPSDFAKANADAGRQAAFRGMRRAVEDGNFLGDMRRKGDRVGQLAKSKAMNAARPKQINIGLMPKTKPEVIWDKGEMSINWSRHTILIDWDGEYMPELTVDPKHSVEVFLRTEPYFRVAVEEVYSPDMPGIYVDQAI